MKAALMTALVAVAVCGLGNRAQATRPAPLRATATSFDSHIELQWQPAGDDYRYVVELSHDQGRTFVDAAETTSLRYLDFPEPQQRRAERVYRIRASHDGVHFRWSSPMRARTRPFTDDELLEMVQRYTFRYFWEQADPQTGWVYERTDNPDGKIITAGGTGFGAMALLVGAERGFITRQQALDRMHRIVGAASEFERFHGMWAHWYDASSKRVYHFSPYDDGGDVVESALLLQGLLAARQYFDRDNERERRLRTAITQLWHGAEWDFYTRGEPVLYWHWSKNHGWKMNLPIRGYNEALIAYVLAASSPTHPIQPEAYHSGWASGEGTFRNEQDYYGYKLPLGNAKELGGPLFFAHYSYLGLDPRGLRDKYADYWEQNCQHTLINRAYCLANPKGFKGYGQDLWGLTAGDNGRGGYYAHAPGPDSDRGVINPTAAVASLPYAPEHSLQVIKNLYRNMGQATFGPMGFYDAIDFNIPGSLQDKVRKTYLAIDQGPVVIMIENYRSGLLWKHFMRDNDITRGLQALGFERKPLSDHFKLK